MKNPKKKLPKKIQNDKKLLENKLEQIQNKTSKSSGIKVLVGEKDSITDPIQITCHEDVAPVEQKHTWK